MQTPLVQPALPARQVADPVVGVVAKVLAVLAVVVPGAGHGAPAVGGWPVAWQVITPPEQDE